MVTPEMLQEYEKAKKENQLWWLKQLLKNKFVLFQLTIIAIFILMGLMGLLGLAPYDYAKGDLTAVEQGPSWSHIFGTDGNGRDLFSRILYASTTSVSVALLSLIFGGLALTIGLGVISGYYGRWRDWLIMRAGEFLAMMPGFFMLIYIIATVKPRYESFFLSMGGPGRWLSETGKVDFALIFLVFSLLYWVGGARLIRSQTLAIREGLYIDAARISGASHLRIIWRHVLPNLTNIIILQLSSLIVAAVSVEIGLSFLNLGVTPPYPSFGSMFSEAGRIGVLEKHLYLLIFPAIFVTAFILAIKRLADNWIRVIESRS